jgi:GntR family transcriptional regulator/MocR family aminotransferase
MLSEFLVTEMARGGDADRLPLHRQLYEALRRAVLDGQLSAGDRLPSSRELTQDLGLSRNTVVAALNQLAVEGYLVSRVGSGTFVNDELPRAKARSKAHRAHAPVAQLSRRGTALSTTFCATQLEIQPFTPGPADFSAFPVALWQRLQNKHWRMTYPDMLDYSYSGGHAPLRRAVAQYLRMFRSVPLDIDQVIITSGTQQSLELCAQLLADHGDTVWLEDPAYWGAVKAFMATGLHLHAVPVDEHGMAPRTADEQRAPRLIYTTPSHQYPTGAVMSLTRRQQLLSIAEAHKAWILEDDYDSEFRFSGPPLSSLAGLDHSERVLYMGSFSKVLYPGLKLGYLVVPKRLVDAFKQAHYDLNRPGQMPLQAALRPAPPVLAGGATALPGAQRPDLRCGARPTPLPSTARACGRHRAGTTHRRLGAHGARTQRLLPRAHRCQGRGDWIRLCALGPDRPIRAGTGARNCC